MEESLGASNNQHHTLLESTKQQAKQKARRVTFAPTTKLSLPDPNYPSDLVVGILRQFYAVAQGCAQGEYAWSPERKELLNECISKFAGSLLMGKLPRDQRDILRGHWIIVSGNLDDLKSSNVLPHVEAVLERANEASNDASKEQPFRDCLKSIRRELFPNLDSPVSSLGDTGVDDAFNHQDPAHRSSMTRSVGGTDLSSQFAGMVVAGTNTNDDSLGLHISEEIATLPMAPPMVATIRVATEVARNFSQFVGLGEV